MKPLTKDSPGIEITLTCEPEELPLKGNVMASDDEAADNLEEARIAESLNRGNEWAWCCAHVRVMYKDTLRADDYLGACSYDSAEDFIAGGYYADMVNGCIDALNAQRALICDCG